MTIESFQDTLFEDPIGLRFRHAREKRQWTLETVAQQLKLPVAILDAIEREDWARLGAPIFVRSYVGSYAKALGLPAALADDVVRGKPAPQLVAIIPGVKPSKVFDRGLMNLAYLAMTILIVGSVVMLALYFQGPKRGASALPMDVLAGYAGSPAATTTTDSPTAATVDASSPGVPTQAMAASSPMAASLVPELPAAPAAASVPADQIVMRFRGESWVDMVDRAGVHFERGLVAAGTERRYPISQLAKATLGDAKAVDVDQDGVAVDLAPLSDANIARFTVSSDGKIAPAAGK